jgi:predicted SAM-dependent methyltransferase
MKAFLRKIVRAMAGWPLIGRLLRIGVAVIRLPEDRNQLRSDIANWRPVASHHRDPELRTEQLAVNQLDPAQLGTLLEAISRLNAQQLATENSNENLRKSVPIALRKVTRDIAELKTQMAGVAQLATDVTELKTQTAGVAQLTTDLAELKIQTAAVAQLAAEMAELKTHTAELAQLTADMAEVKTHNAEVAQLHQQAVGFAQHLQSLQSGVENLQAESLQANNRAKNIEDSVSYATQRIEFVRRELMFELRYGAGKQRANDPLDAASEILSKEKLAAAREGKLRLNLGCGHIALDDYINVDRRALPGVDIVAEVNALPLETGAADEIFSSHLLEHFPEEQLRRELLPYYHSLLKTGGVFRAVVPDAEAMISHYALGDYPYEDMREVIYGAQDYDGDFHFNMFTPDSLKTLLSEAGFNEPKVIESGRKNGRCYEFEIVAEKK